MQETMDDIVNEMKEITAIADKIYNDIAGEYFHTVRELADRFQCNKTPVTDDELETILTLLPLKLFEISEAKSKVILTHEVAKLKAKEHKTDDSLDYKLAAAVYNSVITRIDREMTYTRELIMSSKKLWDSRRAVDTPTVGEVVTPDLPDYDTSAASPKQNTYIR